MTPTPSGDRGRNASLRVLRRRCESRVKDLPLPDPFDVRELCRGVAARRGRPITLLPVDGGSTGALGLWVATGTADLILYERATTPPHQVHIVLHELAHVLCDHYAAPLSAEEQMRLLLPDIDPETVRRVLGRTHYRAVEEQEAELMATLIRQRVERTASSGGGLFAERLRGVFDWPDPKDR